MAEVSAQMVKELRDKTGAGMMDCKAALAESAGDVEKAIEWLRKKGLKNVSKRSDRDTTEGLVYSYIHPGDRVGVLLEINCETDFVARSPEFKELARTLAMHIAWAKPRFVHREEVPAEVLESEREIVKAQLKPEQQGMAEKIIGGKLEKFYEESCLLDQIDVREQSGKRRIGDAITDLSAKVGERIVVKRFSRFEIG